MADSSSLPDYLRPTPRTPEGDAVVTRDISLEMAMMGGMGGGMGGGMNGGRRGGMGGGMNGGGMGGGRCGGGMGGGMNGGYGGGMGGGGGMNGGMGGGMGMMMMTLNGMMFDDPVTEMPVLGTTEIWQMVNMTGVAHPMHLHTVRFQILDRRPFNMMGYRNTRALDYTGSAEAPNPEEMGWRDVAYCPPGYITRVIVKFDHFPGMYDYHCHILEHEENAMMRPFEILPDAKTASLRAAAAKPVMDKLSPNPFWAWSRVMYSLPGAAFVNLRVIDAAGRTVRTLTRTRVPAGRHSVFWDGTDDAGSHVTAGVYFVRLQAGDQTETRRATLMR